MDHEITYRKTTQVMSVTPESIQYITDTTYAFWRSKVLLSSVELKVFTHLGSESLSAEELGERTGIHPRAREDLFDSLVAMHFITKDSQGRYRNTAASEKLLVRGAPTYMGGLLEMTNDRIYQFWGNLTEALKTGKPQNETKETGTGWYEALYASEAQLEQFLSAMAGYQGGNFALLCRGFDFGAYESFCDIGGASGALCIEVARTYPNVRCINFDLPAVAPIAERRIRQYDMQDRVSAVAGDFLKDDFPKVDVIAMGNILHNWDEAAKRKLIERAFTALSPGGALIVLENIIDGDRRKNIDALLMSLHMLVETAGGFESTTTQFDAWCKSAGFSSTEYLALSGGMSAGIARK